MNLRTVTVKMKKMSINKVAFAMRFVNTNVTEIVRFTQKV